MKTRTNNRFATTALMLGGLVTGLFGGPAVPPPAPDPQPQVRTFLPDEPAGSFTLGTQFSDHLSGVYLDSITGLWAPVKRDAFIFLDSRYHYEDNGQFISSTGLGFRKLFADQKVILGANVFWDSVHSRHDNDINQLGLGVEVLTEWVDARVNYYRPEDDRFAVGHTSGKRTRSSRSGNTITTTTDRYALTTFETGLEGFNAEVGVKIPWLDRYAETRVFAGYYHYENPFGHDFGGFKARLEARVLQGVTANVEYWEDAALMGGHWTAGVAVSVPFSVHNLFTGKNPFEGASESFKPVPRRFESRMGDMVERSHRIQTVTSGPTLTSQTTRVRTDYLAAPSGSKGAPGVVGFPTE